ncbi:MAG: hypothetical protein ACR2ML_01465 [Solirubrobacteraceae bacterium]|jgi:hypothetical protein
MSRVAVGRRERAGAELLLDDVDRHARLGELDGVGGGGLLMGSS